MVFDKLFSSGSQKGDMETKVKKTLKLFFIR